MMHGVPSTGKAVLGQLRMLALPFVPPPTWGCAAPPAVHSTSATRGDAPKAPPRPSRYALGLEEGGKVGEGGGGQRDKRDTQKMKV